MVDLSERPTIGPYALTREIAPADSFWSGSGIDAPLPPPRRFLALHLTHQTSHGAYRFDIVPEGPKREAFRLAVECAARTVHPHMLRIERVIFDPAGHPWVITPFTGDVDGVRTLGRLLKEKGGQMTPTEAERAVVQLLEALWDAHTSGATDRLRHHGRISLDHVLVDRHGCQHIELFGLARALSGSSALAESALRALEVRSIVEIGYQLVTGLRAELPLIPARRLMKTLDPRWDTWFARGMTGGGFTSCAEALGRLPSRTPEPAPRPAFWSVRGVVARLMKPRSA